mgnify:CR=1 FL=1
MFVIFEVVCSELSVPCFLCDSLKEAESKVVELELDDIEDGCSGEYKIREVSEKPECFV